MVAAEREARALGADAVGPEHLLLAYVVRTDPGCWFPPSHSGAQATVEVAPPIVSADALRAEIVHEEAEALARLGITLEAVREQVERELGPAAWAAAPRRGHLPFTGGAKQALELALREALDLRQRRLTGEHVLLGLLRQGRVKGLLERVGVEADELQAQMQATLARVSALATR